jgi:hypothetical protein
MAREFSAEIFRNANDAEPIGATSRSLSDKIEKITMGQSPT